MFGNIKLHSPISSIVEKYSDVAVCHGKEWKENCHQQSVPHHVSLNVNPIFPKSSVLKCDDCRVVGAGKSFVMLNKNKEYLMKAFAIGN